MNKSRSITEIFDEAKDFGLVITSDAPLATALNRSVDKPRLGLLAMTPRQLALKFGTLYFNKLYSKSELILEITRHSGKSLKYVHQSIEKILEIWNHTGLLESCELFLTQEKDFLKYLEKYKTVEYAMEKFDEKFYGDLKIAVAGYELFNELDKQVLPKIRAFPHKIELMKVEELKFNKTFLFNSTKDLINSVTALITPENQNETALIFNTDSELKDLLKSSLSKKGIKLEIKTYLKEDISVSNYLSFIESSFNVSDHLLKDIFFTESMFGINLDRKYSDFNLNSYILNYNENKILKSIFGLMKEIERLTFFELYNKLESISNKNFSKPLKDVLVNTELGDKKINPERLNTLIYFIINIEIEIDRLNEGVLFVNAGSSAFVDRQITVFIGLDESWTKLSPDKAYVDKSAEEKKNLEKFQILLSQGNEKIYFAQNIRNNTPVIPCYYFNILTGKNIKNFEDIFFSPVTAIHESPVKIPDSDFRHDLKSGPPVQIVYISPTSLNSFFKCPKKYSYEKLIKPTEKNYFLKGTLLHCFAEFYFNHPEYAKSNFDNLLDLIMEEFSGFVNEINSDAERSEFKVGMYVIMDFLDSLKNKIEYEFAKRKKDKIAENNFLFKKTKLEKEYLNTEKWLKAPYSCIIGKIDLTSGRTIVDYKSSRSGKSSEMLIKEFNLSRIKKDKADDANFQTISYITGKREDVPDSEINFIYLYLLLNFNEYIKGTAESGNSQTEVVYIPETFKRFIISPAFYDKLGHDIKSDLTLGEYRKIILDVFDEINFYDLSSLIEKLETRIHNFMIYEKNIQYKKFGKKKENTFRNDIIQPLLKSINSARKGSADFPFIYKDDADNFLKYVREIIDEINTFNVSDFPNRPVNDLRSVCQKCDYLNICPGNKLLTADEQ